GSGTIAVFDFNAIASGTTTVSIENVTALNSSLNTIPTSTEDGSFVVEGRTTAVPEIDPAGAAGALVLLAGILAIVKGRSLKNVFPLDHSRNQIPHSLVNGSVEAKGGEFSVPELSGLFDVSSIPRGMVVASSGTKNRH